MMKHKKMLVFTSILIVLPVVAGLLLWGQLPEKMPTHWGFDGQVDGWSGKAFAVFGTPVILLGIHWLVTALVFLDARNRDQPVKAVSLILYIFPVMSWVASGMIYATAMGMELDMATWPIVLAGVLFLVMGNYFPKMKRNYTMGIRLPWTVSNEENWVKTHRFGGKVWVVGGLLMIVSAFLPTAILPICVIIAILLVGFVPIGYSYLYYRKQRKENSFVQDVSEKEKKSMKVWTVVALVIMIGTFVFVGVMLFTGDMTVTYTNEAMQITADYWPDKTVQYSDIESVEYREQDDSGIRTNGFGSPRLSMGTFRNDEFGSYTRYSYTQCPCAVVLHLTDDKILVVSGQDEAATKEIYEALSTLVSQSAVE